MTNMVDATKLADDILNDDPISEDLLGQKFIFTLTVTEDNSRPTKKFDKII